MSVVDRLASEVTALRAFATGAVAFVGVFAGGFDLLASTAGTWFPMVAVSATAIFPEFGYAEVGEKVLLVAAFTYVGILAARLGKKARKRL